MKKMLFAALLAGLTTLGAAAPATAQTTPASEPANQTAAPAPTRPTRPLSKEEQKRRRKTRQRTGPVEYKGRIAEQSEFLTDTDTDDKGKDGDKSDKKARPTKRRKN